MEQSFPHFEDQDELQAAERGIRKGLSKSGKSKILVARLGAVKAVQARGYCEDLFETEAIAIGIEIDRE